MAVQEELCHLFVEACPTTQPQTGGTLEYSTSSNTSGPTSIKDGKNSYCSALQILQPKLRRLVTSFVLRLIIGQVVFFVRHGRSFANEATDEEKDHPNFRDSLLNSLGYEQAKRLPTISANWRLQVGTLLDITH